jgi:hypothetical protein
MRELTRDACLIVAMSMVLRPVMCRQVRSVALDPVGLQQAFDTSAWPAGA